jgi:hypothetical protein
MDKYKNIPDNFNVTQYILLNQDLSHLNEDDALYHYENHGVYENRRYNIIPHDFNYKDYLELNSDLHSTDEITAKLHYETYGFYENRQYKKLDNLNSLDCNTNSTNETNNECIKMKSPNSQSLKNHFLNIYGTEISQLNSDPKVKFRYFCFKHLNYIKNITIPDFYECSELEAVLVEFRCFPHIEFIIRNNILKLGCKWGHTVICGNNNYDYVKNICEQISPKIKVIHTNYNNLTPSQYSELLCSVDFWNLLHGKKILIYQEDSIIFKNNIDYFLYFDYIGAPWYSEKNDNKCAVGNGGISLRTKDIMIKIIKEISVYDTKFNSDTLKYMNDTKSSFPPEDVYFTKNMEDLSIGVLADRDSAFKFSTESIFNENSFAGHNFWYNDPLWKNRLKINNVFKFHPNYELSSLEHRGGWKYILDELNNNNFFSNSSKIEFLDVIEKDFLWNKRDVLLNKWCGIIHCTNKTPPYLNLINIENLFKNKNFIESLKTCVFLICFSSNVSRFLIKKINCELNLNIKIYTLKHPVIFEDIPLFDIHLFAKNPNKHLIQIGQQLRKMTSIYLLNNIQCSKLWLTGTKKFEKVQMLLEKEIEYLKIEKNHLNPSIIMKYTETFEEYDNLLTNNLVFIDLFDASANNTVLECIVRNTPIIVNKIDGIIDYLGEDYPLYYNELSEVASLINGEKILLAHEYLKKMDKTPFKINTFLNKLYDIVYENFGYV